MIERERVDAEPFTGQAAPELNGDGVPQFCGVYAIRNRITGGMYVGATKGMQARWKAHAWALRAGRHSDPLLQSAWDQNGATAFQLVLIEAVAIDRHPYGMEPELREAERRWLLDLMDRGAELYNRTLPKSPPVTVVVWDSETMLSKPIHDD